MLMENTLNVSTVVEYKLVKKVKVKCAKFAVICTQQNNRLSVTRNKQDILASLCFIH